MMTTNRRSPWRAERAAEAIRAAERRRKADGCDGLSIFSTALRRRAENIAACLSGLPPMTLVAYRRRHPSALPSLLPSLEECALQFADGDVDPTALSAPAESFVGDGLCSTSHGLLSYCCFRVLHPSRYPADRAVLIDDLCVYVGDGQRVVVVQSRAYFYQEQAACVLAPEDEAPFRRRFVRDALLRGHRFSVPWLLACRYPLELLATAPSELEPAEMVDLDFYLESGFTTPERPSGAAFFSMPGRRRHDGPHVFSTPGHQRDGLPDPKRPANLRPGAPAGSVARKRIKATC